jgi:hypothetical protein
MTKKAITSFSGSDMMIYFLFPDAKPVYIGTASTVTYSSFRETRQVRTLGRISTKGITRGPRTIGGTIIFTVINQHVIHDIMDELKQVTTYKGYDKIKPDELPPFSIVVSFANEYGQAASKVIYGATIVDDGVTLSIEDIFTENQMTYIARDIQHMKDSSGNHSIEVGDSYKFRRNVEAPGYFTINKIDSTTSYSAYIRQSKLINTKYRNV